MIKLKKESPEVFYSKQKDIVINNKILDFLKKKSKLSPKKIIYVSCNPATMARDIEIFISENYLIKDLQPIDMFPHTPHIECVTTLILN